MPPNLGGGLDAPHPGPIARAIDTFAEIVTWSEWAARAWDAWERSPWRTPGDDPPSDLEWHLPDDVTDFPALAARKAKRRDATPGEYRVWTHLLDERDDMVFALRKWRAALEAARLVLPDVTDFMDDKARPAVQRWTSEVRGTLNDFGGLFDPLRDGEIPSTLDREEFTRLFNAIRRHLRDLKRVVDDPAQTEHPALRLYHALNGLHGVCSNAGAFRELAERRAHERAARQGMFNVRARIASDRGSELARAGAPLDEQFAAMTEALGEADGPTRHSEPAEYRQALRENLLDPGRRWCERAREALGAGGAVGLDAATKPNAEGQPWSIEIGVKLREAERVFDGLLIGIGDVRVLIDEEAAAMADLGAWFGRTRDELAAVLETRGTDAPTSASPRPHSPSADCVLTADHESILAVLAKTPTKCRTVIDISSCGLIRNRETVGRLLRELAAFGLVHRPYGRRKGYALTEAGRKRTSGASPT